MKNARALLTAAAVGLLAFHGSPFTADSARGSPACQRPMGFHIDCSCPSGVGRGCICAPCQVPGGIWCQERDSETCNACGLEYTQGCDQFGSCNCRGES